VRGSSQEKNCDGAQQLCNMHPPRNGSSQVALKNSGDLPRQSPPHFRKFLQREAFIAVPRRYASESLVAATRGLVFSCLKLSSSKLAHV
jgi:hypothetical protein